MEIPDTGGLKTTQGPSNPQSKVIFGRFRQLSAINAHKMAPRTDIRLQERARDAPMKGLLGHGDILLNQHFLLRVEG